MVNGRRLWRWLAVVCLAGLTSFGVIVSSAGGASALVPPPVGLGWSIQGGLTLGGAGSEVLGLASPASVEAASAEAGLCAGFRVQCAVGGVLLGAAAVGAAACADFDKCHDTWWPALKDKLGWTDTGNAVDIAGKTDCTDFPPGQCNVPQYYGQLSFVGTFTKAGGQFSTSAASFPGNTPYVLVKWTCANGHSDGYGITAAPSQTYTVLDVCASSYGGIKDLRIMSGGNAYVSGTWNPMLWGNDLVGHFSDVMPRPAVPSTSVLQCKKGVDGTIYNVVRSTDNAGETGIPVGHCDPNDIPWMISLGADVGAALGANPDWSTSLRPTVDDARKYPACAGAACGYQVYVDGLPCVAGASDCWSWTTIRDSDPSRVSCYYGPYVVPVKYCNPLERNYEDTPVTADGPNTDGNPGTSTNPHPNPHPSPSPSPSGSPSTAPRPDNCSSGSSLCHPVSDPHVSPQAQSDCWPSGFGAFNPANWVLQPLGCAFIPKDSVVTSVRTRVKTDIDSTGVTEVVNAVRGPLTTLPSSAGCQGPELTFPLTGDHFYPVSACQEPIKTAALIVRSLSTIVIVLGGGLGLMRLVGAGFGFNVSFRGGGGS